MNIAITGEGIVSAIGLNKQEVLQSLLKKQSGIGKMKHLQSIHHELAVGEVDLSNEKMKEILGIPASQMMSRTALMGTLQYNRHWTMPISLLTISWRKKREENICVSLLFLVLL